MRSEVITTECDLRDGLEATSTAFSLDNQNYDIDLCPGDTIKFHETVSSWARVARKVPKSRPARAGIHTASALPRRPQVLRNWSIRVRAWALDNDHIIPANGRIPDDIKEEYIRLTGDRRPDIRTGNRSRP